MLTNSVAFFTTAIFNTPNGKILPQKAFLAKFGIFCNESRPPRAKKAEPYSSIPVSRSMTVSLAALKVSGVAMMVTVFLARVIPV